MPLPPATASGSRPTCPPAIARKWPAATRSGWPCRSTNWTSSVGSRALTDAALQQYLASEEAARAARIALVAEVSQAYLSYDGALRRLALTRQTLVSREYSFALIDQRRAAGAATALDYQEALGLVEQARAEQERNLRQKQQAFNALVLLLGSDDAAQAIPRSRGSGRSCCRTSLPARRPS